MCPKVQSMLMWAVVLPPEMRFYVLFIRDARKGIVHGLLAEASVVYVTDGYLHRDILSDVDQLSGRSSAELWFGKTAQTHLRTCTIQDKRRLSVNVHVTTTHSKLL